ncbi:hypothetical protein [uncultured Gammaproteobacteria bacterium]|jgi:hypothetical protein|nr:hypothetical protein [uncultured Gammaproteobacteria bacterium]
MNYQNKFPIYCDAIRLVITYTLASEMRTIAYDLLTVMPYTINNKNNKKQLIKKVYQFSEVLKIKNQISKQIINFSFKVFETLVSLAIAFSKGISIPMRNVGTRVKQTPCIFLLASKVIGTINAKIANSVYYFICNKGIT